MPFYEYECTSCKFYTEVMQRISDAPLQKCPSCGKKALKKLVSAPVFRLKGGGWYETDFKSDKEGKRNIADREEPPSKSEEGKAGQAGKPGDSKPAAASAESAGKGTAEAGGSSPAAGEAKDSGGGGESRGRGSSSKAGASAARRAKPVAGSLSKPGQSKPAQPKPASKGRAKSSGKKKGRR